MWTYTGSQVSPVCEHVFPDPPDRFEFSMPSAGVDCTSQEENTVIAESKLVHYSVIEANSIIYHSHRFSTFQMKVIVLATASQDPFYRKCLHAASRETSLSLLVSPILFP